MTDLDAILAFNPGKKEATTAVGYNGAEILWAKNTPVHVEDLTYLENVFDGQSSSAWRLLERVILPKCKPRILHLAEVLAHSFRPIEKKNLFS